MKDLPAFFSPPDISYSGTEQLPLAKGCQSKLCDPVQFTVGLYRVMAFISFIWTRPRMNVQ